MDADPPRIPPAVPTPGRARLFEAWLNFVNRPLVFAVLAAARRLGPVVRLPGLGPMVNDGAVARTIMLDSARFNSHGPGSFGHMITRILGPAALINMDGPAHQTLKRQLLEVFSSRYVQAVTEQAGRPLVDGLRAELAAGGAVDLAAFMQQYGGAMACALVGVRIAPADRARAHTEIFHLATEIMALAALRRPALRPKDAARVTGYVRQLSTWTRASYDGDAGPDLSVTQILRAQGLPFAAVEALVAVILVGATELIIYGLPRMAAVLIDSGVLPILAADPALTEAAIDEAFRVVTPSNVILRSVTGDTAVDGHRFRKGERVLVAIRNVMRQRTVFDRPDEFQLGRAIPGPLRRLPFGAGVHTCLGTGLALAETRQVLDALIALGGRFVIERRACNRGKLYPGYRKLVIRLASPSPGLVSAATR